MKKKKKQTSITISCCLLRFLDSVSWQEKKSFMPDSYLFKLTSKTNMESWQRSPLHPGCIAPGTIYIFFFLLPILKLPLLYFL